MKPQELQTILVVEDERDIRKIVRISLEEIGGFNVETCCSGMEALEKLQQQKPDLVVMDVMMPNLDGPATLDKIRQIPSLEDLPIIFITAKVQPHEVKTYLALGILGVISKPFNPLKLPDQIRQLWQSPELVQSGLLR